MTKQLRRKTNLLTVFFLVALCFAPLWGQESNVAQKVREIESKIKKSDPDEIWQHARDLQDLGQDGLTYVQRHFRNAGPKAQLVYAKMFFQFRRYRTATALARRLAFSSRVPTEVRVMAIRLLTQFAKREAAVDGMDKILDQATAPPQLKIEAAKALRKVGHDTKGSRFLKRYLKSSNFKIKVAAAIALAEIGNHQTQVRQILEKLATEPTTQGRYAQSLLQQIKLLDSLSKTQGLSAKLQVKALEKKVQELKRKNKSLKLKMETGGSTGEALLDEIIDKIERYYDYENPKEIKKKSLVQAAAKGITDSLDPHSVFFTPEQTKQFQESMSSRYPGIGAYIQKAKNGYLKVSQPIYSGPAYKAGLRSGDLITEIHIDGKWTKTNSFKVTELVTKLRGPAGSKVRMKVWRKSWDQPREFIITRQFVKIPFVYTAVLPGDVGYLRLTSFGEKCVKEFEAGLKKLEKKGIKGLILDLRNNPGGLLSAAVKIVDKFIKGGKLIVYSKGRNKFKAPRRDFKSTDKATHPDFPMTVLVNGNSASASEIVSGALKIHKRARLVGTKTYGKGSVQELMALRSTGNKALLKLTIAKYYLPDGTNIDQKGIVPDIKVKPDESEVTAEDYAELLQKEAFEKYLEKHYKKNKKTFQKLGYFDYYDYKRYPHFDELYKSLKIDLPKNAVRQVLRRKVRQKIADEVGHILVGDYQEDNQLQVAIFEVLKRLGVKKSSIPQYKKISDRDEEDSK